MQTYSRIGVFGGSFNPPHQGHIHLCKEALRTLNLSKILWLITPQNPFKAQSDYLPFDVRTQLSQKIIQKTKFANQIFISTLEQNLTSNQSVDTLKFLKTQHHPNDKLIWLMGADNLIHFHIWERWQQIFEYADVAVFDRHNILEQDYAKYPSVQIAKSLGLNMSFINMQNIDICSSDLRLSTLSDAA